MPDSPRIGELESRIVNVSSRQIDLATPEDVKQAVKEAKRYRGVEWFRQYGTAPVEAWYLAGQMTCGGLSTYTVPADTLFAIPFHSGRGGRIDGAAFRLTGGNAATRVARIGLYSNTSDTKLYPYQLVVDFGEQDCSTAGVKNTAATTVLAEDTPYWAAFVGNNAALIIRSMVRDDVHPCFGIDSAFGTSAGWGLSVAFTYAALPQNFPGGATIATGADVPAIGFRLYG